jgi:hypothetical protein
MIYSILPWNAKLWANALDFCVLLGENFKRNLLKHHCDKVIVLAKETDKYVKLERNIKQQSDVDYLETMPSTQSASK